MVQIFFGLPNLIQVKFIRVWLIFDQFIIIITLPPGAEVYCAPQGPPSINRARMSPLSGSTREKPIPTLLEYAGIHHYEAYNMGII